MKNIVSGVQPTGRLHLGNYFGAIKQHIALQRDGHCYYFIANYHALTSIHDANQLRHNTLEVAKDYMALGMDVLKNHLFVQNDVPQVNELAWILATCCGMGLMERQPSYKDKIANGVKPNVGLFTYPLLMAADILIQDADLVPVGEDQVPHVEFCRDVAGRFNNTFNTNILRLPGHVLTPQSKVIGIDGRKMSKSYNNTIPIFATGKELKAIINGIKTDSTPVGERMNVEGHPIFELYRLFTSDEEVATMLKKCHTGCGWGYLKTALIEKFVAEFQAAHDERLRLHENHVISILNANGRQMREKAEAKMFHVRRACGLT
jgi:tryptophanyl-tRNA synthetase